MYLRVPWIGKPSSNLEKEVKTAVESCYGSVSTRLVFTSKRMLPVARKDVLPAIQKSFVIYEYKCHCDSRYVGRTSQRLQDRIKQHVPQWLRQQLTRPRRSQPHRSCKRTDTKPDCDSAIGQHLLDNDRYALNYDDKRFSILAAARSSFHLNLLSISPVLLLIILTCCTSLLCLFLCFAILNNSFSPPLLPIFRTVPPMPCFLPLPLLSYVVFLQFYSPICLHYLSWYPIPF